MSNPVSADSDLSVCADQSLATPPAFSSQSGWLRDALSEIDPTAERLSISFSIGNTNPTGQSRTSEDHSMQDSENEPTFRLEAVGTLGSTEVSGWYICCVGHVGSANALTGWTD